MKRKVRHHTMCAFILLYCGNHSIGLLTTCSEATNGRNHGTIIPVPSLKRQRNGDEHHEMETSYWLLLLSQRRRKKKKRHFCSLAVWNIRSKYKKKNNNKKKKRSSLLNSNLVDSVDFVVKISSASSHHGKKTIFFPLSFYRHHNLPNRTSFCPTSYLVGPSVHIRCIWHRDIISVFTKYVTVFSQAMMGIIWSSILCFYIKRLLWIWII